MEKIISINFQGRVIPIEEPAYNMLREYVDGLRRHFADEEGSDEIISDIENRIAELLSGKLRQGASCINAADLNAVIDSIGRIEDIKAADEQESAGNQQRSEHTYQGQQGAGAGMGGHFGSGRFRRNADDKVIAGVCSGIAERIHVDPVAVRIIFVVLSGALFWLYLLLWLLVPSESISSSVTRRLFRNADDKMIAGVCAGLAVYFKMDTWKVRLIFLAPLVLNITFGTFHPFGIHWHNGPDFLFGSLISSFFILYLVLWIAVPYATSSTEKMEMRGEKIDLNSIKAASQSRGTVNAGRSVGAGIGRIIGILFKAFFLFLAGIMAIALLAGLIALVVGGMAVAPFTHFLLNSWNEYMVAWTCAALTLGVPVLALIVWLIRRLMGVRSRRKYLAYVFAGLWIIGLLGSLVVFTSFMKNFGAKSVVETPLPIQQPVNGKLYVTVEDGTTALHKWHGNRFFDDLNDEDAPFHIVNNDSLWLNTVRVNVEQSSDSLYHLYCTKVSRSATSNEAQERAKHIRFDITQRDSVLLLPNGFTVSAKDKFRNQQVVITIEVPMGKKIQVADRINTYSWYNVESHGSSLEWHSDWTKDYEGDREYTMTPSGLASPHDTVSIKSSNLNED